MAFSAVLLAGGESRRMRTDKATLIFRGEPLWQRQIDTLRDAAFEKIFLSARAECAWRPRDVELLLDDPPSRGPLSGIAAALARSSTSHLLALAIDMPLMTASHLRYLCSLAAPGSGIIPLIGERAEPLAAIYPAEAVHDFAAALKRSDFALQPLVRRLMAEGKMHALQVRRDEQSLYRNLNEPVDLAAIEFARTHAGARLWR